MKIECDGCGYEKEKAGLTKVIEDHAEKGSTRIGWLCKLCYETIAGNAYFFPSQYPNQEILRQINYVGNAIFDAIKEKP